MHDDPRLTAYALGELDESERALVESWLDEDPELAVELGAIDDVADLLGEAFEREHELRPVASRSSSGGSSTGAWWTLAAAAAVLLAIGVGVGAPDAPSRAGALKTAPLPDEAARGDRSEAAPADDVGVIIAERDLFDAPIQCTSPSEDGVVAEELPDLLGEPRTERAVMQMEIE